MIDAVIEVIGVARYVAVALAGLSLVFIGIKYMTGSGNEDAALLKMARNVIIAMLAIWMIAPIISLGRSIVDGYAWNPDEGEHGMVSSSFFDLFGSDNNN